MKELSSAAVDKLMREPGRHAVGPRGLYLQVTRSERPADEWPKSWLFRYQRNNVSRHMGLGAAGRNGIPLKVARDRVQEARIMLSAGVDPVVKRQAERAEVKLEKAKAVSFKRCGEQYIAQHRGTWKNEVHRRQWESTLEQYVYPIFGDISVGAVETSHIIKALEPIWSEKPETASRVRGRVEVILDWAKVRGFREGDNPARWRGHLDKILPRKNKVKKVRHHPAMPYAQVPVYMAKLRTNNSISARALEFTILTAVRTSETIKGQWVEVADAVWTIPAERMKAEREHRIPLSDRANAIIEGLHQENDFLFPGAKVGRPLSNMAMLELLQGMHPDLTVHGFRSSFRDWAAEETDHPNHVVEMALAHAIGDDVEAAYRRGELFEKRKKLMDDWAAYCASAAA